MTDRPRLGAPKFGTVLRNPAPDDAGRDALLHDGAIQLDVLAIPEEISIGPGADWA